MGRHQRFEKVNPSSLLQVLKEAQRNLGVKPGLMLSTLSLALWIMGCSHSQAQINPNSSNSPYFAEQLTFIGNNENASLSDDGKNFLFQSRDRAQHKSWQIYHYDLTHRKERRVTFSDGDAFDPVFFNNTEIIYASTTDEIKKDPFGARSLIKRLPSDLYMSDLYGNSIERLTKQVGYDAQPFPRLKPKPSLLFSSFRGDILGLYQLDLKTLVPSLISAEKGKDKLYPSLSPDQQIYSWLETSSDKKEQNIFVMTVKNRVSRIVKTERSGPRTTLCSTTPSRLIYSLTKSGKSTLELYDVDKNCTQTLYSENALLASPQLLEEVPSSDLC